MEDSTLLNTFSLQVDNGNVGYLIEASKWGKFLSILGFIGIGIMILCGFVFMLTGGSFYSSEVNTDLQNLDMPSGTVGIVLGLYLFVIALVYFFPCLFLYKFSTKMQEAIRTNDQIVLNKSFENLKSLFKFFGIVTIIVLSMWIIAVIFSTLLGSIF
ncbi:MAG TPA: DUF5362 family protein [Parafilimonas sp.]|nr:DUF5362 family protein [Parafilimonas sp.]